MFSNLVLNLLPFTYEQINLAFLAVVMAFVVFSVFFGLIRGLKKTAFRGVWLLLSALAIAFVVPMIADWLIHLDISFLNIQVDNVTVTTAHQFVTNFVTQNVDPSLATSNPMAMEAILKIPFIIINILLFVVLFWLVKMLLYPVWAIMAKIIIKKKNSQGEIKNKHRLAGMAVGGVIGLMIGAITLMPVIGIISLANTIETKTATTIDVNKNGNIEDNEKYSGLITLLTDSGMLDPTVMSFMNSYNSSTAKQIYDFSGMNAMTNAFFKTVSTVKVDKTKINLEDELVLFAKAGTSLLRLQALFDDQSAALTQVRVREALAHVRGAYVSILNSNIVRLADGLIETVSTALVEGNNNLIPALPSTGNQSFDEAIIEFVSELADYSIAQLSEDIKNILDAVELLNDANIIIEVYNSANDPNFGGEIEDFQAVSLQLTSTPEKRQAIEDAINKILDVKLVSVSAPLAINVALTAAFEQLDQSIVGDITLDKPSAENLKATISGVVMIALDIFNSIDPINTQNFISAQTVVKAGQLIDTLKAYEGINQQTYDNLVARLINWLNTQIDELAPSITPELVVVLKDMAQDISTITSFENEVFAPLALIVEDALTIIDVNDIGNIDVNTIELNVVGRIIDNIKSISIINNHFEDLLASAIDFAVEQVTIPTEFEDTVTTLVAGVKANISQDIVWEDELALFGEFVDFITTLDLSDTSQLLTEQALGDIGTELNALKESELIGNQITNIVKSLISFAEDSLPAGDQMITDFVEGLKTNLDSAQDPDWKVELQTIGKLISTFTNMPASLDATTAGQLGKALDEALDSGSQIITKPLITSVIVSVIDQFASDPDLAQFEGAITVIKNNLTSATTISFEKELEIVFEFAEGMPALVSSSDFTGVGAMLDSIIAEDSVLITRSLINTLIEDLIDSVAQGLDPSTQTLVTAIKNNISTIDNSTTYEKEIGLLFDLIDKVDTADIANIGLVLDEIVQENSKLITQNIINTLLSDMVDVMAASLDPNLAPAITQVKNNIANIGPTDSYNTEITTLFALIDGVENATNLQDIGLLLDQAIAQDTVLVTPTVVNTLLSSMIDDLAGSITEPVMATVIAQIKTNVNSLNENDSYEEELNVLLTFVDGMENATGLSSIGQLLDSVLLQNKKLVDRPVVNTLLKNIISETATSVPNDIANLLVVVEQNVVNVVNGTFETELGALDNFMTFAQNLGSASLSDIGTELDGMGNFVLLEDIRQDVLTMVFDSVIANETDQDVVDMLTVLKQNALTKTASEEITYGQAMQELENAIADFTTMSDEINKAENFDDAVLGGSFNNLKNNELFGPQQTATIAETFVNGLIGELEQQRDSLNPADPLEAMIIADLQDRIDDLQLIATDISNNNSNMAYDYVNTMQQVSGIISA